MHFREFVLGLIRQGGKFGRELNIMKSANPRQLRILES